MNTTKTRLTQQLHHALQGRSHFNHEANQLRSKLTFWRVAALTLLLALLVMAANWPR